MVFPKYLLVVLSGIHSVFEMPKSGISKYLLAVLSSTHWPVIHYMGMYSKMKWMKDKNGYDFIYIYCIKEEHVHNCMNMHMLV